MTNAAPTTNAPRDVRKPTSRERFLATHANKEEESVVNYTGSQGEPVQATHIGATLVVLYRATTWGWESVAIPSSNIEMCLHAGMRENCGDCDGDCSPDPFNPQYNSCPGRPKFATRRCPECRKLIYDFEGRVVHPDSNLPSRGDEDEADVGDNAYPDSTPATRTKVLLDRHIARYHSAAAQRLGLRDADIDGLR